jgi:hypothetical protein
MFLKPILMAASPHRLQPEEVLLPGGEISTGWGKDYEGKPGLFFRS